MFYLLSILPRKSPADLVYFGGFTSEIIDETENWRDNRNDYLARQLVSPKEYTEEEASIYIKTRKSSVSFGEENSYVRPKYEYEEDLLEECDGTIYKGLGKLRHFKFVE